MNVWQCGLNYAFVYYCVLYILLLVHSQDPVVPHATYQMDREATPAPLLGAESLTPVTQGTGWLQVVLVEHVSHLMDSGQGVIQHVDVSLHYCALPLQQHISIIICSLQSQATVVLLALFLWMEGEVSLGTLMDTQSLTPATQDTGSLESLPEDVSPTAYGLEVSLHVQVSV